VTDPDSVRGRFDAVLLQARRIGPGPMLVRGGLFFAALLAQLLAWPGEVTVGWGGLILLLVAAATTLAPQTRLVTVGILAAVAGWLASTTAYGEPVAYWRLVLLAASLYAVHTLAALAAVLPFDTIVSASVLAQWMMRAGLVVALTLVVAMFTLLVPAYLGNDRYLLASLVGLAVMIALAGYLAALVRRR
jgi:hypothetical protein